MRRLPALLLTSIAVLALAACSAGRRPGWTYAPAASATAGSVRWRLGRAVGRRLRRGPVRGSVGHGRHQRRALGRRQRADDARRPSAPPRHGFDPTTAEAAAGERPSRSTFDNEDDTAPHNLVIKDASGEASRSRATRRSYRARHRANTRCRRSPPATTRTSARSTRRR